MTKWFRILLAVALVWSTLGVLPARAVTTQSNVATIALTATVASSLTVTVDVASLSFTNNNPVGPVNVTTSWNLASGQATQLNTVVYFNQATALSGTTGTVSTGEFICINPAGSGTASNNQVLGGITFPFTCPFDFSVNITAANLQGTNTTPYQFQIPNLLSKPAGTMTGTLNVQALAF